MALPHHPPISYGTQKEECGGSLREAVKRVSEPIFEKALKKVPQEEKADSMAIYKGKVKKVLWRPNNYRRQMRVKPQKKSFINSGHNPLNIAVSQKGLLFVQVSDRVKLQYGKKTLTAIWSQKVVEGEKEIFSVPEESFAEWLSAKKGEIASELDEALFSFARKYDLLLSSSVPKWERYEDWVRGEEFLDGLPLSCVVYADGLKKVYEEGVEFVSSSKGESPAVHAVNYISNRMVERLAPEIARSLDRLAFAVNPLLRVKELVVVFPDDLLRVDVQVLIAGLLPSEKLLLSEWLFERFGVGA